MDLRSRLKSDLKRLSSLANQLPLDEVIGTVTKQLGDYEVKVKKFVQELDLAKEKSRKQVHDVVQQIRKTRTTIEDRVADVVSAESKRLNNRVSELLGYLVRAAAKTQPKPAAPKKRKKSTKKKSTGGARKKKAS